PPPNAPAHAPAPARAAAPPPRAVPAQAFAEAAPEYAFRDPDRKKKLEGALAGLDGLAEATLRGERIPGLALGVVIDGELAYAKGFGFADVDAKRKVDRDTVFRIGSITKSFTALTVLSLRDDGRLALDDPLARYLPEAAGLVYPTRDTPPITLRELLAHRSGLPRLGRFEYTRADREPSERDVLDSLAGFSLENPPGTTFVYSNLGFALLGIAASRAAGVPYRELVAARLLRPLGMRSTSFDAAALPAERLATGYRLRDGRPTKTPPWRLGGAEAMGGLSSTLADMARYAAFQLAAYPPRDDAETLPVRRSTVREAHEAATPTGFGVSMRDAAAKGEPLVAAHADAYAFGWGVSTSCDFARRIDHNGAVDGFVAEIHLLPDQGVGVVVLGNLAGADLRSLARRVLEAMQKSGGLAPRERVVHEDPAFATAMRSLLGVYAKWDEALYRAMLTAARPAITPASERAELAGYKAIHGECHGYRLLEAFNRYRAKFAMQCDKGDLEMTVALDPANGKIYGFGGVSRGLPVSARLKPAADAIASLVGSWSDRLYEAHLAHYAERPKADAARFFAGLRARHGACRAASLDHAAEGARDVVTLACERGGDVRLTLAVDDKKPELARTWLFAPVKPAGVCPVK
ncbi:MAG TPA: serine hydrolase domain-containing protein, partial [Minicystis sp.]|nr:serine hydrolase domain-containing protein [Minicystis sp.]